MNNLMSLHPSHMGYCTMSYDLECEFDALGSVPDRGRIICGSLMCSCGYKIAYGALLCGDLRYYNRCESSTKVAVSMLRAIESHMPLFIVGHNCYQFDNRVLCYWICADLEYTERLVIDRYFRVVASTSRSDSSISLLMTVPGVNNVDTMVWFMTSMYSNYRSFGLDNLCRAEGLSTKTGRSRFSVCINAEEMTTITEEGC
ncbi:unnamed protein product [Laminaria digitata]